MKRLVVLESPYAGNIEANVEYARKCVLDSLKRGEAPIASHLLYTQPGILNDDKPLERQLGINAGLEWTRVADASVVYTDLGISDGMKFGIITAVGAGISVEYRTPFLILFRSRMRFVSWLGRNRCVHTTHSVGGWWRMPYVVDAPY